MSQILNDNVQVTCLVDGDPWIVEEAEVSRSRVSTPDYVKMIIAPDEANGTSIDSNNTGDLIGKSFRLEADNELISERTTGASEDSLLFVGNMSNISPLGDGFYDAIAFDPSQQVVADPEAGSLLNQEVFIPMPETAYEKINNLLAGTIFKKRTIKASKLVKVILQNIGVQDFSITISDSGTVINGTTYAKDTEVPLNSPFINAAEGLKIARNMTASEWWFDKEGVLNFGAPDPKLHELKYITDASDGKTTPPYKSVKIIGSGIASEDGFPKVSMESEDKLVFKANIKPDTEGKLEKVPDEWPSLREPTYTYRSAEIVTDDQAKAVAKQFISDMSEQQSDGEVTVVGFPEIMPLDGIKMPSKETSPRQPMGGYEYGVYEVIHRLNSSDGFITKISVSGTANVTRDMCFADSVPQPAEDTPTEEDQPDSNSLSSDDSGIEFPAQRLFQTAQTPPELDLEEGDYPAQNLYNQ